MCPFLPSAASAATFLSLLSESSPKERSYKCIHTDFWLMLCSSTAYFIPGKKGCQPKNIISHCRVSSIRQPLGRLVFIFACWVVGSHTDFLFCLYIPCSLISGISLLSFSCTGKTVKGGGISVWGWKGGDRNHLLSWPVLPIPPGLKSSF